MNNKNNELGFSTRAIHHGYNPQDNHGALIPPIYLTSTFTFATADLVMPQGVFFRTLLQQLIGWLQSPEGRELADDVAARKALFAVGLEDRAVIAKKLNDMVTKDSMIVVPLVHRGTLSAHSNALGGVQINAWDSELWNVADWFRVK